MIHVGDMPHFLKLASWTS